MWCDMPEDLDSAVLDLRAYPAARAAVRAVKERRKQLLGYRAVLQGLQDSLRKTGLSVPNEMQDDIDKLTQDIRDLHLFDNFLRGRPYSSVERNSHRPITAITSEPAYYGISREVFPGPRVFSDCFFAWVKEDVIWHPSQTSEPQPFTPKGK